MPSDGTDEDGPRRDSRRVAVREFLHALGSAETYNPRRNIYALFGLLWGLPVPFFSVGIHLYALGRPWSVAAALDCCRQFPLHTFFALHPLLFGAVFGAMGTVRLRKDRQIGRLIDRLETQVRALAEANDRLKDMDRMKTEFLANVSHELKTPLVCLSGYTEMIAQGRLGAVTGPQTEALAVMERNAERLLRLIEELLEFGRSEAGRSRVSAGPFDLAETVRAAAESLAPIIRERGLRLVLNGAERPVGVRGDREKILRVLVNLLSNACKFTPAGRAVGVRLVAMPDAAEVVVWDEGIGLTEEDRRHLFERFWRAASSPARAAGGTGLGLAIVKEILDRHGREIEVASAPGQGTRFQFTLPLAPCLAASCQAADGRQQ